MSILNLIVTILLIVNIVACILITVKIDNNLMPKNTEKVKFTKLHPRAKVPSSGSAEAAGYDLYSVIDNGNEEFGSVTIPPHTTEKIRTGLGIATPKGYFGAIFARSGLATKCGLRPANCVGM